MANMQSIPGIPAKVREELILSCLSRNPIALEPRERRWKGLDPLVEAGLVLFVKAGRMRAYHITEKGREALRTYQKNEGEAG